MTDSTSNQQFISNLSSVLSHLKPNTKCFIYGNFNYDLLQAEKRCTSKFIETTFDHCFYQGYLNYKSMFRYPWFLLNDKYTNTHY